MAAMSRRSAQQGNGTGTAGGTQTSATGANNPYTRHAVAAPPVTGTTQRQYPNGPQGNVDTGTGAYPRQNPYARSTGGTPYAGGPTAPLSRAPQEPNPYARPAETGRPTESNPYAQPVQPTNPYAKPSTPNPYAQSDAARSADSDEPANPTPRRTSRASRYQNRDGGDTEA